MSRKKKYQIYDFSKIIHADALKNYDEIEALLSKGLQPQYILYENIRNIYNYYNELTNLKPSEYENFETLILSSIDSYNPISELNFYFYLKAIIEKKYKLIDKRYYFQQEQEYAVLEYVKSRDNTVRRNAIYNRFLKMPLEKMVESQINKYKMYPTDNGTLDSLIQETVSVLLEKINLFDTNLNTKAYSYLGTISIRYLIACAKKAQSRKKSSVTYIDFTSNEDNEGNELENNEKIVNNTLTENPDEVNLNIEFFKYISNIIKDYITDTYKMRLLDDDKICVGLAISEIIDKIDYLFLGDLPLTRKIEKNDIIAILMTMTNLPKKKLQNALKFYKDIYFAEKLKFIKNYEKN